MNGYHRTTCWKCNADYYLPPELYRAAKASDKISFFCPYGHEAHFRDGPTEADKLRQERDRLNQRLAEKDDEIIRQRGLRESAERSISAHRGQLTKLKNRAKAGLCPCCNRHFTNLERHMATKHADMDPAEPLKVIEGGKP